MTALNVTLTAVCAGVFKPKAADFKSQAEFDPQGQSSRYVRITTKTIEQIGHSKVPNVLLLCNKLR
jgi:hypothetical protein